MREPIDWLCRLDVSNNLISQKFPIARRRVVILLIEDLTAKSELYTQWIFASRLAISEDIRTPVVDVRVCG